MLWTHRRTLTPCLAILLVSCLAAAEPDLIVNPGTTVVDGGELGLGPGSVIDELRQSRYSEGCDRLAWAARYRRGRGLEGQSGKG